MLGFLRYILLGLLVLALRTLTLFIVCLCSLDTGIWFDHYSPTMISTMEPFKPLNSIGWLLSVADFNKKLTFCLLKTVYELHVYLIIWLVWSKICLLFKVAFLTILPWFKMPTKSWRSKISFISCSIGTIWRPGDHVINILQAAFQYKSVTRSSFSALSVSVCIFLAKGIWQRRCS